MGVTRIVNTDFWIDGTIIDQYSPEDKYFWLYLLTNPQTKQLGIYKLPRKLIAFQMGYSLDTVNVLLDRFQNKYGVIEYSDETQEVAILNYLKYSIVKGGKPVVDCITKDISQVKDKNLLSSIYKKVVSFDDNRETMLVIKELLLVYSNDNYIDNDNDNDNDSIVDVSPTYRKNTQATTINSIKDTNANIIYQYENLKNTILLESKKGKKICEWCKCKTSVLHRHHYPVPKRLGGMEVVNICSNCHAEFHVKEGREFGSNHSNLEKPTIADEKTPLIKTDKPQKSKYGDLQNVKLTDKEVDKLNLDYGEIKTLKAIQFLSSYKKEKTYKTADDNLTIRRWVIDAVNEKEKKKGSGKKANPFDEMLKEELENEQNGNNSTDENNKRFLPTLL